MMLVAIVRPTGKMGRAKTKPAEGPQLPGEDGATNGSDLAQPQLPPQQTSRKQRRRLARRRRRQLKKLERQLLGQRSRLRPRLLREAAPFSHEQLEAVVGAAVARALEREREGLLEQATETIDDHLKEMSESLERRQREAEKRIIVRTERSLEQMAQSASKRLNREVGRLRSELRSETPFKVSRGGEQSDELTEQTIDERLAAMSKSWERRQQKAEKEIILRTEHSLEQMAQSANKRLNREAARLRSELRNGTPSKASRERNQQL
jgi:F0F1-type ATP synthase membrane subunit b/b'